MEREEKRGRGGGGGGREGLVEKQWMQHSTDVIGLVDTKNQTKF